MSVPIVGRMRTAFFAPTMSGRVGWRGVGMAKIASVAVAIGLFTISWERIANVAVGPYNVKLPSVLFSVAAVLCVPAFRARGVELRQSRPALVVGALVAAILLLLIVALVVSAGSDPAAISPGAAQVVSVLTGAILPAAATVALVRDRTSLSWALRWFLAGAALSSAFGLYQLAAFYLRIPQGVPYDGTGVDGVTGRIAAFNYEPAYFATFMLFAFAAAATLALLQGRTLTWWLVAWFALVLVLANVRALLFVLPVFGVLLAAHWHQNRRLLVRMIVSGVGAGVVVMACTTAIVHAVEQAPAAGPPPSSEHPSTPVTASTAPVIVPEETAPPSGGQPSAPQNVLNPDEESSNAPRLTLYRAVLDIDLEHLAIGVGPGRLGAELEEAGTVPANQTGTVVANNIWLQAVADGGLGLLLAELGVVVAVALLFFRRVPRPMAPLFAAWLTVVLVSGMLTSYFFDIKVWVVLALLISGSAALANELTTERTPATR